MGLMFLTLNSVVAYAADDFPLAPLTTSPGTNLIAAGIGLESTPPDTITFTVPTGASIVQALLYWEGYMNIPPNYPGDNEITVNGTDTVGEPVTAGPVLLGGMVKSLASYTYRADITDLIRTSVGAGAGNKELQITNMAFDDVNDGAGVLVILDDGTDKAEIEVREGNDFAYINGISDDLKITVAQTFYFAPDMEERTASLELMFTSIKGQASGGGDRTSAIDVTIDGTTTEYNNLLGSVDGEEWDTVTLPLTIPANTGQLTVQAFSEDRLDTGNLPASLHWLAAGLAITPPQPVITQGRMTGGGKIKDNGVRVKAAITIHCDITLSNNIQINWKDRGKNKWHLTKPITSATCIDNPSISPHPPAAPFDTFIGESVGKLNGKMGSILRFTFVDGGEPGKKVDSAAISIWAPGDDPDTDAPVLEVSGKLRKGNYQAHYDQPHKLKAKKSKAKKHN